MITWALNAFAHAKTAAASMDLKMGEPAEVTPIARFLAERFHVVGVEFQNWMAVVASIFILYITFVWIINRFRRANPPSIVTMLPASVSDRVDAAYAAGWCDLRRRERVVMLVALTYIPGVLLISMAMDSASYTLAHSVAPAAAWTAALAVAYSVSLGGDAVRWLASGGYARLHSPDPWTCATRHAEAILNWSLVDTGTSDYAADAWATPTAGPSSGIRAHVRCVPAFDLSLVPNSTDVDPGFGQFQWVGEIERRYDLFGQPGKIAVTGFLSRGRMGSFDDAVELAALTGGPADITAVRRYTSRSGVSCPRGRCQRRYRAL